MRNLPFGMKKSTMTALCVTMAAILLIGGLIDQEGMAARERTTTVNADAVNSYQDILNITSTENSVSPANPITTANNGSYVLNSDITVGGTEDNPSKYILGDRRVFSGFFDGCGHTIRFEHVTFEVPSSSTETDIYQGLLFGEVTGTVQNLFVEIGEGVSVVVQNTAGLTEGQRLEPDVSSGDVRDEYADKDLIAAVSIDNGDRTLTLEGDSDKQITEGDYLYFYINPLEDKNTTVSGNDAEEELIYNGDNTAVTIPGYAVGSVSGNVPYICQEGHVTGTVVENTKLTLWDGCKVNNGVITDDQEHSCMWESNTSVTAGVNKHVEGKEVYTTLSGNDAGYSFTLPCGCKVDYYIPGQAAKFKASIRPLDSGQLAIHKYDSSEKNSAVIYYLDILSESYGRVVLDCGCVYKYNPKTFNFEFYLAGYGCRTHTIDNHPILVNGGNYGLACGCTATYNGAGQFTASSNYNSSRCWKTGHAHRDRLYPPYASASSILYDEVQALYRTTGVINPTYPKKTLACGCKIGYSSSEQKLVYTEIAEKNHATDSVIGETLSCHCTVGARRKITITGEELTTTRTDTNNMDKTFYIGTIAGKLGENGDIQKISVGGNSLTVESQAYVYSQKNRQKIAVNVQGIYNYLEKTNNGNTTISFTDPTDVTAVLLGEWSNDGDPYDRIYAYSDVFTGGIAGSIEGGAISQIQQTANIATTIAIAMSQVEGSQQLQLTLADGEVNVTSQEIQEMRAISYGTGGIVGRSETGGTVEDCYVEGTFTAGINLPESYSNTITQRYAGGIIGYNDAGSGTIVQNSIMNVSNLSAANSRTGMIYGYRGADENNRGVVRNCYYHTLNSLDAQGTNELDDSETIGADSTDLTPTPSNNWVRFIEQETQNEQVRYLRYRYVLSWLCRSVSASDIELTAATTQPALDESNPNETVTNYNMTLLHGEGSNNQDWGTIQSLTVVYDTRKNLENLEERYVYQNTAMNRNMSTGGTIDISLGTGLGAYIKPVSMTLYNGKYYFTCSTVETEESDGIIYPFGKLSDFQISFREIREGMDINGSIATQDQDFLDFSVVTEKGHTPTTEYLFYGLGQGDAPETPMVKENLVEYDGDISSDTVEGGTKITMSVEFPFDEVTWTIMGFWTVNDRIYPVMHLKDSVFTHGDEELSPVTTTVYKYQIETAESEQDVWNTEVLTSTDNLVDHREVSNTVQRGMRFEFNEDSHFQYFYRFVEPVNSQAPVPVEAATETGGWTRYSNSTRDSFIVPIDATEGSTLYLQICKQSPMGVRWAVTSYNLDIEEGAIINVVPQSTKNWIINGEVMTITVQNLPKDYTGIRCYWTVRGENLTTLYGVADVTTLEADANGYIEGTIRAYNQTDNPATQGQLYLQLYGEVQGVGTIAQSVQVYSYIYRHQNDPLPLYPTTGTTENSAAALLSGGNFFFLTDNSTSTSVLYTVTNTPPVGDELQYATDHVQDQDLINRLTNTAYNGIATHEGNYYILRGENWYQVTSASGASIQVYNTGDPEIVLENLTNQMQIYYVTQMVCGGDLDPSSVQTSVYKVQGMGTVATPVPAITTASDGTTKVPRGAKLYFSSATPNAEIYYATGTFNVPEDDLLNPDYLDENLAKGDIYLYDPDKGIEVQGEYETRFSVKMIAIARRATVSGGDVIGYENIMVPSALATYIYTVDAQDMASDPTSTPTTTVDAPATVLPGGKILLSSSTTGAEIIYTLDGTNPTVIWSDSLDEDYAIGNGMIYDPTQGIVMPENGSGYYTIKALAVKNGLAESNVVTLIFQYPQAVQAPFSTPIAGSVNLNTEVSLGCGTEGALIYYEIATGDTVPADPTLSSAIFDGSQNFVILQKTTIKAFAVKDQVRSNIVTMVFNPTEKLGVPVASIASGAVVARGTTVSFQAAAGATIYYTTDGSDPADAQNPTLMIGNSTLLDGEPGALVTIKLCAKAAGKSPSDVVTYTYQISQYQGGVSSDTPSGSEVDANTTINLTTDIAGAVIYYTLDGSTPSTASPQGSAVLLNGTPGSTVIVKAIAITSGGSSTTASIFTYRIKALLAQPSVAPAGGMLSVATDVTVTAPVGQVYYTLDGSEPTANSELCNGTIRISRACTLRVIAISEEGDRSAVASYVFQAAGKVVRPVADRESGVLEAGEIVYLSTETDGARIYYSTDGTTPTVSNYTQLLTYTEEGIAIHRTVTIQAIAVQDGMQVSPVVQYSYTVENIPGAELKQALEAEAAAQGLQNTDTSQLKARRETTGEIPARLEEQTIYTENFNRTLVAVSTNTLADDTRLSTTKAKTGLDTVENVEILKGEDFTILEAYEMKLYHGSVDKYEDLENVVIALPIPVGYENASLTVAAVDDKSHVELLSTTREGSMLYANAGSMGTFAIIGPKLMEEEVDNFNWLYVLAGMAALTVTGGVCYLISQKIKRVREKNYPKE